MYPTPRLSLLESRLFSPLTSTLCLLFVNRFNKRLLRPTNI